MIFIRKLFFDTLPSTNTYAKENIDNLSLPVLIIANEQTEGRGRRGNSFYSPKDTGLYMTLVFEERGNSELLTPLAAVAVCEVLSSIGADPKIKWVNDIFINGKKVCGILAERTINNSNSYITLGIGLNITTQHFPVELKAAGSININCDKEYIADKISDKILDYYQDDSEIINKYRQLLFVIGKEVTYFKNNIEFKGFAADINENCNLIIKLPDGSTDILSSGEISIRI
ncbi:MAG: biotin--[Clostridia bacterium]|nr:biotin--[acetyl-CoA-carboxylase] ligase [Clostridia bacterium]